MTKEDTPTCSTCQYYVSHYIPDYVQYECRRYAPKIMTETTMSNGGSGGREREFPLVDINDWCGEHKEKTND